MTTSYKHNTLKINHLQIFGLIGTDIDFLTTDRRTNIHKTQFAENNIQVLTSASGPPASPKAPVLAIPDPFAFEEEITEPMPLNYEAVCQSIRYPLR